MRQVSSVAGPTEQSAECTDNQRKPVENRRTPPLKGATSGVCPRRTEPTLEQRLDSLTVCAIARRQ